MSQGEWQDWNATPQPQPYAYPPAQPRGFDPADPLISNDFNGWWQRSFRLVKAAWRSMAVIQAIVAVPTLAVLLPAMVKFQDIQREALAKADASVAAGTRPEFFEFFSGLPLLAAAVALVGFLYLVGQLACQQVVVLTATGRAGNLVGPALWAAAKRLLPLVGWYLLTIPVLIVALVLCFFPVIYVGAVLTILPAVVLLERGNGIGRCFQLFHASVGVAVSRVATYIGLSLAAGLLLTVLTTVIDAAVGGSVAAPSSTATVINTVLQTGYYVVVYVVLTPLLVTAYADMRARYEPFTTAYLVPEGR